MQYNLTWFKWILTNERIQTRLNERNVTRKPSYFSGSDQTTPVFVPYSISERPFLGRWGFPVIHRSLKQKCHALNRSITNNSVTNTPTKNPPVPDKLGSFAFGEYGVSDGKRQRDK